MLNNSQTSNCFEWIKFTLFVLLFIIINLLPIIVFAASSSNYQTEGLIDYGGGFSSSENYQIVDSIGNSDIMPVQSVTPVISPSPTATSTVQPTIKPTSTPTTLPKEGEVGIIGNIIDKIIDFLKSITDNPIAQTMKLPIAAVVASLVVWATLVPIIMNLPMASPISSMIAWFIPLFSKRKKPWGKVYDSETGQGISLVAVRLFEKEFNKLLKTELTDNKGRFGFLVGPGKYYIQVVKKDFAFPSKAVSKDYHGQILELKKDQPIIVDIPLDSNKKVLEHRLNILSKITDFLAVIRIPLLVIGTLISIAFVVVYHRTIDIIIISFYSLIWIWEIYGLISKSKAFGNIFEFMTHTPVNLAIIRVFNDTNNKLVSTKVSNAKGRFRFMINQGDYYTTASKQGYERYKSEPMIVVKQKVIAEDIILKPRQVKEQIPIIEKQKVTPTMLDVAQDKVNNHRIGT